MASWRPNQKQWLVIWPAVILGGLSIFAGLFASGALILVVGAVLAWRFDSRGRKPENLVVKSARCVKCGNIGEPHWASCPKCGATNWKEAAG